MWNQSLAERQITQIEELGQNSVGLLSQVKPYWPLCDMISAELQYSFLATDLDGANLQ